MSLTKTNKDRLQELREACVADLWTFARVVEPHRVYGEIHEKLFKWWQYEAGDNSLCLLPRDHQKSHCMAVLGAWLITRDPSITILYISATSYLAQQQLRDIKNILTSKVYALLWPEMLNEEEGKREKWTNTEICVDNPKRKEAGVRDSTVFTAGLTTNTCGLHCKVILKDDVVVPDNAYTEEGRRSVAAACSQLASILTTGGKEYCVGTRYHPKDHYNDLKEMTEEVFTSDGDLIDTRNVYSIFEYQVETAGKFLWPKQFQAETGKPFGFDFAELARKKAKYIDVAQFWAQYYNDPNNIENARLSRDKFQYYNKEQLAHANGVWTYHGNRLNIYAAVDFAYSTAIKADSTCIVVVGINHKGDIYVLDINRFKTNKMDTYFQAILEMYNKWDFIKLRAEVNAAQETIVEYIQDRARQLGMGLKVEKFRPNKYMGAKEERIKAVLEPRYDNLEVWHYKGGYTDMLEEELLQANPKHDDIKDTLASVCSMEMRKPQMRREENNVLPFKAHSRFGGVSF